MRRAANIIRRLEREEGTDRREAHPAAGHFAINQPSRGEKNETRKMDGRTDDGREEGEDIEREIWHSTDHRERKRERERERKRERERGREEGREPALNSLQRRSRHFVFFLPHAATPHGPITSLPPLLSPRRVRFSFLVSLWNGAKSNHGARARARGNALATGRRVA